MSMKKVNKKVSSEKAEFNALLAEFSTYEGKLRATWLAENRPRSNELYELMRPEERAQVHACMARWAAYITPLAEAWWEERGYEITWPDDDSKPVRYSKLEPVK